MIPNDSVSFTDIPLILDLICNDLSAQDIRSCALVSREWHQTFSPCLWRYIRIHRKHTLKHFRTEAVRSALRSYASHVRSLITFHADLLRWLQDDPSKNKWERKREQKLSRTEAERNRKSRTITDRIENLYIDIPARSVTLPAGIIPLVTSTSATVRLSQPYAFRNLTVFKSLSSKHNSAEANNTRLFEIMDMVEISQRLRVFSIDHFIFEPEIILRISSVIRSHPSLKELSLTTNKSATPRLLRILFINCCRLEKLILACKVCRSKQDLIDKELQEFLDMPDTDILHLDFGGVSFWRGVDGTLLPFLSKCHKLRSFVFPYYYDAVNMAEVMSNCLPKLRRLDFSKSGNQDHTIFPIIQACRSLEAFKGKGRYAVGQRTVEALLQPRHTLALQEICLSNCIRITGAHIQVLLKSCPNLISFHGMDLDHTERHISPDLQHYPDTIFRVADMEANPGWTCYGLKVLALQFEESASEIFPRAIYEQISELKELDVLCVGRVCLPVPVPGEPDASNAGDDGIVSDSDGNTTGDNGGDSAILEEKVAKDKNLAEAFASFHALQHLRILDLTNIDRYFYRAQRQELKDAIPTLKRIVLY